MTAQQRSLLSRYASFAIWPFLMLVCLHYAVAILDGGQAFLTGDWLINYYSGPVRRGLIGTALLAATDAGLPLLWATYVTQVLIYFFVFYCVQKIYLSQPRGLFWLLILFSPTFILSPFYDMGVGFRKEIIVMLAFSYFCTMYLSDKMNNRTVWSVGVIFTIAVFSHELAVFTLPFFLYMVHLAKADNKLSRKSAAIFAACLTLVGILALVFAMLYKGDEGTPDLICKTLVDRGLSDHICGGAIAYLDKDAGYAIQQILNIVNYKVIFTIGALILSLLPLLFTNWLRRRTLILVSVGLITMLPLFALGTDWGRWVHILVFMTYTVCLTQKVDVRYPFRREYIALGLIFLTTWSLPHSLGNDWAWGLIARGMYYGGKLMEILG